MTRLDIRLHSRVEEMFDWIVERCGPSSDGKWRLEHLSYIVFEDEKDAVLFALKWL